MPICPPILLPVPINLRSLAKHAGYGYKIHGSELPVPTNHIQSDPANRPVFGCRLTANLTAKILPALSDLAGSAKALIESMNPALQLDRSF